MAGPTGVAGGAALWPVDLEYCIGTGLVPIPRQPMVDHSVLDMIEKVTTAIEKPAQVKHLLY